MVDRDGLENRCAERYRGFESLLLRFVSSPWNQQNQQILSKLSLTKSQLRCIMQMCVLSSTIGHFQRVGGVCLACI